MNVLAQKFVNVFGPCVIIASLCSGCATGTPSRVAIDPYDLNYFQPDCSQKAQQIAFLQSLRRSPEDRAFTLSGWFGVDDQVNWTINSHILYLKQYC
jgi:hypothetical protein